MPTLREIAQAAGVSISVVSRVLNPRPDRNARVAETTRVKILELAERLHFRPNRAAEFLKRGKTGTIGVFLPCMANRLLADLVFGLAERAEAEGFPLSFSFGITLDGYHRFIDQTRQRANCGIVTYPYFSNPQIAALVEEFRREGGNLVLLNGQVNVPGVPNVAMNDIEGGRLAGERLRERGCRTFFQVGRYPGRNEGFLKAIGQTETDCFPDTPEGYVAMREACLGAEWPVGLFAVTDFCALRVVRSLWGTAAIVGRDVLLVGYDDLDPMGEVTPSMTTVHQPFREMGRIAMDKIVRMIYGNFEGSVSVAPTLTVRESA